MTWTKGCYYRHKRMLDTCVEIVSISPMPASGFVFWVLWWNIGFMGTPWLTYQSRIVIRNDEMKDWEQIDPFHIRKVV